MKLDSGSAVMFGVLTFLVFFVGMTLVVLVEDGLTILVFFSLLICLLLGVALYGAINEPPDKRRGGPPRR